MKYPIKLSEEKELINCLKTRSNEAFAYLYDTYSGALYAEIKKVVADIRLAEDTLQETFVEIFIKIYQYDQTKSRLYTWMTNICRNRAVEKVRSKGFLNNLYTKEIDVTIHCNLSPEMPSMDGIGITDLLER